MAQSLWLKKFRKDASFRGVSFFTESHQFSGGRRGVTHEFPQKDRNRTEDLGKRVRQYSIEMLIFGDDYFDQRDKMVEALETEGSGELIHPYLGRVSVQVFGFSFTETIKDGRMVKFSVEFTEAGELVFPEPEINTTAKTVAAADEIFIGTEITFVEAYTSASGQPSHVLDSAIADINDSLDFMEKAIKSVTDPVSDLNFKIKELRGASAALARAPDRLATQMIDVFTSLAETFVNSPQILVSIFSSFTNFALIPSVQATPSELIVAKNTQAMNDLNKQVAQGYEAIAITDTEFTSIKEAVFQRDRLVDSIDEQVEREGIDDNQFQLLRNLQATLIKAVPLPNVGEANEITLLKTNASLVVVHDIYDDLDREQELIDENLIQDPSFVPGGIVIEVTSV